MVQLNFTITQAEKDAFEDGAINNNLSKVDYFKLRTIETDPLANKIQTIVSDFESNFEEHFDIKLKSYIKQAFQVMNTHLTDHIEKNVKDLDLKIETGLEEKLDRLYEKINTRIGG